MNPNEQTAPSSPPTACPGCGRNEADILERGLADFRCRVPGEWSCARCRGCRLIYLTPRLENPADGYPATYAQHTPAQLPSIFGPGLAGRLKGLLRASVLRAMGYRLDGEAKGPTLLGRAAAGVTWLRLKATFDLQLLPEALPGGRLLEVGCGNGRFLGVARMLGWEVRGVEPDPSSARVAAEFCSSPVHSSLEDASLESGSFDVVVMHHSLEHMYRPLAALQRARELLKPSGELGLAVPNWQALGHRLFGRHYYALDAPRHVIQFEPATLEQLVTQAGFKVREAFTTSVREAANAFKTSYEYRHGRPPSGPATLLYSAVSRAAVATVASGGGEEIVLWADRG